MLMKSFYRRTIVTKRKFTLLNFSVFELFVIFFSVQHSVKKLKKYNKLKESDRDIITPNRRGKVWFS